MIGALLTALLLAAAALSLVWTPWPPYDMAMDATLQPPGAAAHWLGTDAYGRDITSLLLVGARSSILVGVIAVGIGLSLGAALACCRPRRLGGVEAIMRLADFTFAFPALLLAIMLTAVFGPGIVNAIIAIGIFYHRRSRASRASAWAVWARDYILAARACGGPWRITLEHVLPNIVRC